jgi:hypothetical protein
MAERPRLALIWINPAPPRRDDEALLVERASADYGGGKRAGLVMRRDLTRA